MNEQARKVMPFSLALLVISPLAHLLMQAWQLFQSTSDSAHSRKKAEAANSASAIK